MLAGRRRWAPQQRVEANHRGKSVGQLADRADDQIGGRGPNLFPQDPIDFLDLAPGVGHAVHVEPGELLEGVGSVEKSGGDALEIADTLPELLEGGGERDQLRGDLAPPTVQAVEPGDFGQDGHYRMLPL